MAFVVINRGSDSDTYVGSLLVGDTFTPTEGNIIIVVTRLGVGDAISGITGWSNTTFSEIATSGTLTVWAAIVGSSPGSGRADVNIGGSNSVQSMVLEISGVDVSGTIANAFVQNVAISTYNPSSPLSFPSLSAFASSSNLSLNFGASSYTAASFTAQSGFTKNVDSVVDDSSVLWGVAGFHKTSEETAQTLNGTFFAYRPIVGLAFEVAEEVVGGVANDYYYRMNQ